MKRKGLAVLTAGASLALLLAGMPLTIGSAQTAAAPAGKAEHMLFEMNVIDMPLGSYDTMQGEPAADGVPNKEVGFSFKAQDYRLGDGRQLHGTVVNVHKPITVKKLGKVFVDMTSLPEERGVSGLVNSGEHKVELFRVEGVTVASDTEAKNAAVKNQANWESVASANVTMNWDTTIGGFNWTELENPVTIQPGVYVIATEQKEQVRAASINCAYIPPNNIPDAFALAAPTGAALANLYGSGECDVVDCATGTMYGGANFLFTEPEEAVTPPTLAGTKVYELAVTDKPFGSYSIDAIQPHQIANKPGGNDNFGSVFFVNKKIRVHQLGRIYVDPSDVPSKDMGYRPLADSRANNGTHEVALFRIKNASAADTVEANNAALRDSANWEKVASVTVAMNGSAAVDGFNWAALEQPVEIDAGMYVLVTVEDGSDLIMTHPGQVAYAWPAKEAVTHTGVTVGSKYAEGKYADSACAAGGDGSMYGGANMTFTEVTTPPVTPVKPALKGEQVYNLGVTDKPYGSYDINMTEAAADGVANETVDNGIADTSAQMLVNMRGPNDNFGSVFFINQKATVHQLGRVFVDASGLPEGRTEQPMPANSGVHKVVLFRIKGASADVAAEERNALIRGSANWEKVAEADVQMNWESTVNGFNWATLETPVTVDPGMYVVVTVENTDVVATVAQRAYLNGSSELVTHTGVTIGTSFAEGKYADAVGITAGDGSIYGGANLTISAYTEGGGETPGDGDEELPDMDTGVTTGGTLFGLLLAAGAAVGMIAAAKARRRAYDI